MHDIDSHHIDTEVEAVTFINEFVANAVAFVVVIGIDEQEQDSTVLQGSSKFHELRYFFLQVL
jgi:hypothetical protein